MIHHVNVEWEWKKCGREKILTQVILIHTIIDMLPDHERRLKNPKLRKKSHTHSAEMKYPDTPRDRLFFGRHSRRKIMISQRYRFNLKMKRIQTANISFVQACNLSHWDIHQHIHAYHPSTWYLSRHTDNEDEGNIILLKIVTEVNNNDDDKQKQS